MTRCKIKGMEKSYVIKEKVINHPTLLGIDHDLIVNVIQGSSLSTASLVSVSSQGQ